MMIRDSILRRCLTLSWSCARQRHGVRTAFRQKLEKKDTQQKPEQVQDKQTECVERRRRRNRRERHAADAAAAAAMAELEVSRHKLRFVNYEDGGTMAPTISERRHELHRPLSDNLIALRDSGAEMYGRLAAESSSMLEELHGETSRRRLAAIQQRLIFEERQRLGIIVDDEEELKSGVPCRGCGSPLHSVDVNLPGFVPLEIFVAVKAQGNDDPPTERCLRCYTLDNHQKALKVVVPDSEFPRLLRGHVTSGLRDRVQAKNPLGKELEKRGVLFLLLVDALDVEGSCFDAVKDVARAAEAAIPPELLHHARRHLRGGVKVVLIVNKIDLLPKDVPDALAHWKEVFSRIFRRRTGFDETSHVATRLISARTGFGVEDLISDIWLKWKLKGDVYLCGSSNSGKSTLFNTLLKSDFCLPTAMDHISPATISSWPGTTMNMLSFPLNKPNDFKIKLRMKRLFEYRKWMWEQAQDVQKELDWNNVELKGQVGQTFEDFKRNQKQRFWQRKQMKDGVDLRAIVAFEGDGLGNYREPEHDWDQMFRKRFPLEKPVFVMKDHKNSIEGRWVYDTPGIVNSRQLINYLVEEEIDEILPRGIIPPRFCLLREGRSLLISGLAQIDLLEHGGSKLEYRQIYLSVIASHSLPLRVTWNFDDADELRSREEMMCEQTKVKKKLLPLCLEGDDPRRGGKGGRGGEGGTIRSDGDLDLVEGDWRKNEGGGRREEFEGGDGDGGGGKEGRRFSSSSPSSRRRRSQTDEGNSNVDGLIISPFSSSSPSPSSPRPRPLPPWTSQTYHLAGSTHNRWFEVSVAEILLSSIGFVGVSSGSDCVIRVKTFGGGGGGVGGVEAGIRTGDSILMPDIFGHLKGPRGKRTDAPEDGKGRHLSPFFQTNKPYF